jgi:hypothetical protein
MSDTVKMMAVLLISLILSILFQRWMMSRERTQAEISETCEKACAILQKTDDGDLLDPSDLKITEYAVNGYLNEGGREVFEKLYQRVVIDGTYFKPYLHGIQHITHDHEGYIYYKGIHVEHYNHDYVHSEDAKNNLLELKRRCELLERKGIEVSCASAIWGWENHADEYGAERLKELDALLDGAGLTYSRVEIYNSGRTYSYFSCGKVMDIEAIKNHPVTKSMTGRRFDEDYEIRVAAFKYNNDADKSIIALSSARRRSEIETLLFSCHDYLTRHGTLVELPVVACKTDFAQGYEKTELREFFSGYQTDQEGEAEDGYEM